MAAVLGLAVVGLTVPFTIVSFVNEQDAIHRMHNVTGLVGFGGLIGVLLIVTAWRPEENIAAFHVIAATALAGRDRGGDVGRPRSPADGSSRWSP